MSQPLCEIPVSATISAGETSTSTAATQRARDRGVRAGDPISNRLKVVTPWRGTCNAPEHHHLGII